MESCFRDADMYSGCPDGLSQLAPGVRPSYYVAKTAETGTVFTIERHTGVYARTCSAPDSGGCGADSSW